MKPLNSQYIFSKEDATEMVLVGLQLLDRLPKSENGKVIFELTMQDGVLLHTITTTERIGQKTKVKDVLKKFFHVD